VQKKFGFFAQAAWTLALVQFNVHYSPPASTSTTASATTARPRPAGPAIASYTKALQLKEYPATRQKLTKLQAKKSAEP
jgi:hypothetical protein